MGRIGCVRCEKSLCDLMARTFVLIASVHPVKHEFHAVTKQSQMHPNTTKQTKTLVLGPMGWIGCVRCEKSCCDFVARTFALIAPVHPVFFWNSSPCFASSYLQLRNDPKCTQTLLNTPKHEVRVQWGGPGAFAAKNYNVTSWHKLLY